MAAFWTPAEDDMLKFMLVEGKSFKQIGAALKRPRNACIGRAHRLGLGAPKRSLSLKPDAVRKRKSYVKSAERKELQAEKEAAFLEQVFEYSSTPIVFDNSNRVTLENLDVFHCRWPEGDPSSEDFYYCGETTRADKPYCPAHMALAYVPARPRDRKPWRVT